MGFPKHVVVATEVLGLMGEKLDGHDQQGED